MVSTVTGREVHGLECCSEMCGAAAACGPLQPRPRVAALPSEAAGRASSSSGLLSFPACHFCRNADALVGMHKTRAAFDLPEQLKSS